MAKFEKLIRSFLNEPVEVSFSDVKKLLEAFEFSEDNSSGSHHIFRHEDGRMITIPKKGGQKVKGFYVKQVNKVLRLEEWYEQQNEGEADD
jgi:predicted RNA binding protein YcfA (HicA-like mRNA interferase family)